MAAGPHSPGPDGSLRAWVRSSRVYRTRGGATRNHPPVFHQAQALSLTFELPLGCPSTPFRHPCRAMCYARTCVTATSEPRGTIIMTIAHSALCARWSTLCCVLRVAVYVMPHSHSGFLPCAVTTHVVPAGRTVPRVRVSRYALETRPLVVSHLVLRTSCAPRGHFDLSWLRPRGGAQPCFPHFVLLEAGTASPPSLRCASSARCRCAACGPLSPALRAPPGSLP